MLFCLPTFNAPRMNSSFPICIIRHSSIFLSPLQLRLSQIHWQYAAEMQLQLYFISFPTTDIDMTFPVSIAMVKLFLYRHHHPLQCASHFAKKIWFGKYNQVPHNNPRTLFIAINSFCRHRDRVGNKQLYFCYPTT